MKNLGEDARSITGSVSYTVEELFDGVCGGLTGEEIVAASRVWGATGQRVSLRDVAQVKRSYSVADTMVYDLRAIRSVEAGQCITAEDVRMALLSPTPWPNPYAVEAGQIWRDPWGNLGPTGDPVVEINDEAANFACHYCGHIPAMVAGAGGWHCVGYQLPDGRRVMVGERWDLHCADRRIFQCRVSGVWPEASVGLDPLDGSCGMGAKVRALFDPSYGWRRVEPEIYEQASARVVAGNSLATAAGAALDQLARLHGPCRCPRELSRQRVDAAIAGYRGPFAAAVGAGLRAASERVDLTEQQIGSALTMFADYEERRGGRRLPPVCLYTDVVCAAWERTGPTSEPAWEHHALAAYERARAR